MAVVFVSIFNSAYFVHVFLKFNYRNIVNVFLMYGEYFIMRIVLQVLNGDWGLYTW